MPNSLTTLNMGTPPKIELIGGNPNLNTLTVQSMANCTELTLADPLGDNGAFFNALTLLLQQISDKGSATVFADITSNMNYANGDGMAKCKQFIEIMNDLNLDLKGSLTIPYSSQAVVDAINGKYANFLRALEIVNLFMDDAVNTALYNYFNRVPSGADMGTEWLKDWTFNNQDIVTLEDLSSVAPDIKHIGDTAFFNCQNLKSFDFSNITKIGKLALSRTKIESAILLDVIQLADSVFDVRSVTIGGVSYAGASTSTIKRLILSEKLLALGYNIMSLQTEPSSISRVAHCFIIKEGGNTVKTIHYNHFYRTNPILCDISSSFKLGNNGSTTNWNMTYVNLGIWITRCSTSEGDVTKTSSYYTPKNFYVYRKYRDGHTWFFGRNKCMEFIGSKQWCDDMRTLAQTYAPMYNPSLDLNNIDYRYKYVDYLIFGAGLPVSDSETPNRIAVETIEQGELVDGMEIGSPTNTLEIIPDTGSPNMGVTFRITKGGNYAVIDTNGIMTISSSANKSEITLVTTTKGTPSYSQTLNLKVTAFAMKYSSADGEFVKPFVPYYSTDGIGLSNSEFVNITTISEYFYKNTVLASAEDLAKTQVKSLSKNSFNGCTNLSRIDLSKIETIASSSSDSLMIFYGVKFRQVFLPNIISLDGGLFPSNTSNILYDFGKNLTSLQTCPLNFLQSNVVIYRSETPSSASGTYSKVVFHSANRLTESSVVKTIAFVPSNGVTAYQSAYQSITSQGMQYAKNYIYEIGGAEWQAKMQELAQAEGYTLKAGQSWADPYIDYWIYGAESQLANFEQ